MIRQTDGTITVDSIGLEPLIHPDQFAGMFDADSFELHSERRVVYCCGGLPIFDEKGELESLKLYVNVGDKRTVEVTVSAEQLMGDWPQPAYATNY
jgi:hypothetical protein